MFISLLFSLPSGHFLRGLHTIILFAFYLLIQATYPTHYNVLDLTVLPVLGEQYKSSGSSLCSEVHHS